MDVNFKTDLDEARVDLTGDRVIGAIFIFCSVVFTSADVHAVGDARGWNLGVDYSTWTSGNIFAVGDTLEWNEIDEQEIKFRLVASVTVFKYNRGLHPVDEVSARDHQNWSAANSISTGSSGSTTIALKTAGTHYFLC
ncbi:hypothetical protein ACLOJK_016382 [Asimina triloba]